MKKRNKTALVVLCVALLLVVLRLLAPGWITRYVNVVLADIPGHAGSIDDVDLQLWRGAYVIHGVSLRKVNADTEIPFVTSERILVSLQWKSLLRGALVGEIEMVALTLNFASGQDQGEAQYGDEVDWTEPIRELVPIQLNQFAVRDGTVSFINEFSTPPVNIELSDVELEVRNLSNVVDKKVPLPSPVSLQGDSAGGGRLSLNGKMNVLKRIPDFDINLNLENESLTGLNDFLKAYANVDAEQGVFNVYVELAAKDGELTGYVKPIVTDLQVLSLENDDGQPFQLIWEGLVGLVSELLENQSEDQIASRVPIAGTLSDTEARVIPTILALIRNAFVEALRKRTDDTVNFATVSTEDGEAPNESNQESGSESGSSGDNPGDESESGRVETSDGGNLIQDREDQPLQLKNQ